MCVLRVIYRTICLAGTCVVFAVIGAVLRILFSRHRKKHRHRITVFTRYWARCFCFFLNIRIEIVGQRPPAGNALIVSNHVGSPDIYVLGACFQAFYVSKDDVKSWPVVGWLSRLGQTVFVDRSRRLQVPATIAEIRDRLEDGFSVVIFPEGGATDGADVIPFKTSHFEAAVLAQRPVLPVAIRYLDPNFPSVACWYKIAFFRHVLALMKNPELKARVYILPEIRGVRDRRALAEESRRLVREAYRNSAPPRQEKLC